MGLGKQQNIAQNLTKEYFSTLEDKLLPSLISSHFNTLVNSMIFKYLLREEIIIIKGQNSK